MGNACDNNGIPWDAAAVKQTCPTGCLTDKLAGSNWLINVQHWLTTTAAAQILLERARGRAARTAVS